MEGKGSRFLVYFVIKNAGFNIEWFGCKGYRVAKVTGLYLDSGQQRVLFQNQTIFEAASNFTKENLVL